MRTSKSRAALAVAAIAATVPALAAVGPAEGSPSGSQVSSPTPQLPSHYTQRAVQRLAPLRVVAIGFDNPRQLAWDNSGRLLVAEAGHGSYGKAGTCFKGPEGKACVGKSGKVSRIGHPAKATDSKPNRIARGFISLAGPDGTFAVGSDGVDQGRGSKIYVQETYAPPEIMPKGVGRRQLGKLLDIHKSVVANITAHELRRNPDGEQRDSDPYAVLALKGHKLVADAAGDDILRVHNGHVSTWAVLPGDTAKVDPVPTSLARGRNGKVYVGTLYSLAPHKARVLRYSPRGKLLGTWHHFTSVTGVTVGRNRHVYVSELFAGCPAGPSQDCIPGRVVDLAPDGTRSRMPVPFPAGLAWRNGHLYVSAWSIAPAKGALGNPEFSGQVLRIK